MVFEINKIFAKRSRSKVKVPIPASNQAGSPRLLGRRGAPSEYCGEQAERADGTDGSHSGTLDMVNEGVASGSSAHHVSSTFRPSGASSLSAQTEDTEVAPTLRRGSSILSAHVSAGSELAEVELPTILGRRGDPSGQADGRADGTDESTATPGLHGGLDMVDEGGTASASSTSYVGPAPSILGRRGGPPVYAGEAEKKADSADGSAATPGLPGRSSSWTMLGGGIRASIVSGSSSWTMMSGGIRASIAGDRCRPDNSKNTRLGTAEHLRHARMSWFSLADEDNKRLQHAKSIDLSSSRGTGVRRSAKSIGSLARSLIKSSFFECFMALAIFSNSVFIGVEVEYNSHQHLGDPLPGWMYGITYVYTLLFLVELLARVAVHGSEFFRSSDWAWNVFDVVVVASSLVDSAAGVAGMLRSSTQDSMQLSNLRILRVLRVTRLFRTVRIVRIVRFVAALRLLVSSILSTLRSLVWAFVLMALVIYIFAIVFTQSAHAAIREQVAMGDGDGRSAAGCGEEALMNYWGSLASSMFTLYMSITGGLSWEIAIRPLGAISWFLAAIFLVFIFIVYFAVLNVVTGFFCQAASDAADQDPELIVQTMVQSKRKHEAQIKNLFQRLDIHKSGELHYDELCEALTNERIQAHFEGLQVDVSDPWTLFKLINVSRSNVINIDEFIEGCMRLKGPAKSIDIERLMSDHTWFMQRSSKFMHHVDAHIEHIKHDVPCESTCRV